MSVPHLYATYEQIAGHGLSGRALAVYRWLAWRENAETDQCTPSHQDIAAGTGFSLGTVQKALRELRDAGWVSWKGRARERDRGRTSNSYDLTPPFGFSWDLSAGNGNSTSDLSAAGRDRSCDLTPRAADPPPQPLTTPSSRVGEQEQEVELEKVEHRSDLENPDNPAEEAAALRAQISDLTEAAKSSHGKIRDATLRAAGELEQQLADLELTETVPA